MLSKIVVRGAGLKGRNFELPVDKALVILGRNETGKSTRLEAVDALIRDHKGKPVGCDPQANTIVEGSGPGLTIIRTVGAKHALQVLSGSDTASGINNGHKLLAELFGVHATGAGKDVPSVVWDLGGYLGMSDERQLSLVVSVAGVAKPADADDLTARFDAKIEEADEDVRDRLRDVVKDLLTLDKGELSPWLTNARDALGKKRREYGAEIRSKKGARKELPKLADDNAPAGRLHEATAERDGWEEKEKQLREARAAAVVGSVDVDLLRQGLERARGALKREQGGLAAIGDRPDPPDGLTLDEAKERAGAAVKVKRAAQDKASKSRGLVEDLEKRGATLTEDGCCPFCLTAGTDLEQARLELQNRLDDVRFQADVDEGDSEQAEETWDRLVAVCDTIRKAASFDQQTGLVQERQDKVTELEQKIANATEVDTADMDAKVEEAQSEIASLKDEVHRLTMRQESIRMDATNRAELKRAEDSHTGVALLESVLDKVESEVVEEASGKMREWAQHLLNPVLGERFLTWNFEPWSLGLLDDADGFIPYRGLSDSAQGLAVLGLRYAMLHLQEAKWKALLIDRGETMDRERVAGLTECGAQMMESNVLNLYAIAVRCDDGSWFKERLGGNDAVRVIDLNAGE